MKRMIYLLVIFISINVLVGCTNIGVSNEADLSENLIEMVKTYEQNDYLLYKYQINYDTFKENIEDIVVRDFEYKDDKVFLMNSDKAVTFKDLRGLTIEEIQNIVLDNLGEKLYKDFNELNWTTDISKIYEEGNRKYISTKRKYVSSTEPADNIGYREQYYVFVQEKGKWKISGIGDLKTIIKSSDNTFLKQNEDDWIEKENFYTKIEGDIEFIEEFEPDI